MEERVWNTICKYKLIEEDDNIVLGISGGHDSMSLLYLLMEIKKRLSFNLILAHVNHGVRGEDALKDELFVKSISDRLNLKYFSKKVDMVARAKEKNISQEEAGRELRYGFFREIIKTLGKGKIAVAHNRKDQAETLLLRIMRGTGLDGLKAMDFKSGDIIRPILDIDRWEIEKYIYDNKIETVLDRTNLESIYSRNKVRLELIPYIEENFNPNIVDTLFRLSESARIDSEFLEKYTEKKYSKVLIKEEDGKIIFKDSKFEEEDLSIKKRLLRKAIDNLNKGLQGIEEIHITSIIELFSKKETGKKINLPNDIIARVSYNNLIVEKLRRDRSISPTPSLVELEIGENVLDDYMLVIDLQILDRREFASQGKYRNVEYFDYNKIVGKSYIRSRKAGDRFKPLGMRGSKKIKDYFIDEKIPREERDKIPLLVDEENIIWVIGYRTSENYKLDRDTEKILRVEYNKG